MEQNNNQNNSVSYHVPQVSMASVTMEIFLGLIKPKKIFETGTFTGIGTTSIVINSMLKNRIYDFEFCSIEPNKKFIDEAGQYLLQNKMLEYVKLMNGISLPHRMLPDINSIKNMLINLSNNYNINVTNNIDEYATMAFNESNFSGIKDDLIGEVLEGFEYKPDFIILDSAAHLGTIEFDYTMEKIKGDCYFFLDDIYSLKNYNTYIKIRNDSRFNIIFMNNERFGFLLAEYKHK